MARSHPPALLKIAERTLVDETPVTRGDRILCAVSGGGDSSALLHVLATLSRRLGFFVSAHGVDHGLRPEAAEELDTAAALADRLAVPFSRSRVRIEKGGNLQARARDARFAALRAAAAREGCRWIATAHHADDRAETVLIRLLRGSGPSGLAVLPPTSGDLVRPLVRARRTDVVAHLERHRISYRDDPSNVDRRFLRARVRLELMPLLVSLSPGIVGHLNALSDQLGGEPIPVLFDAEGRRVPLTRSHIDQIRRALRRGREPCQVRLPGGRAVRVDPKTGSLELVGR